MVTGQTGSSRSGAKATSYTVGFRQSKTALFDWTYSRADFIVLVFFLEAVGVREYCCTAVLIGWQLCASRSLREQRLDEPSSQRVGGFGLSGKPPKLRSWSCTQPRAAKATAGAAVRCWQHGIDTTRCCGRLIHAAGERN